MDIWDTETKTLKDYEARINLWHAMKIDEPIEDFLGLTWEQYKALFAHDELIEFSNHE